MEKTDSNLNLIFIHLIGKDFKENFNYEFIFSKNTEEVSGDNWEEFPASNKANLPDSNYIDAVYQLNTNINLSLIQASTTHSVWCAVDGIIALAWEDILDYDEYPDLRIYFKYGENFDDVITKIYEKKNQDFHMDFKRKFSIYHQEDEK